MRSAGILFPIFSLASNYGIGCLSKEAYQFIDFLKDSGQTYWQILPIGPTGFGDSPYQPVSAFAGNPYFIDLEDLVHRGLLRWDELNGLNFGSKVDEVDYGALYNNRKVALEKAFARFVPDQDYDKFVEEEYYWLHDYALFMTLKKIYEGKSWIDWDKKYAHANKAELERVENENKNTVNFYYFQQYMFECQWKRLRKYANEKGIKIIGDIPFYCSLDSCDAWSHPEAFLVDSDGIPTFVAGTLPDAFSKTGQLWGNPIYDWDNIKKFHYSWWMVRMVRNISLFDVIRIDHFHGFAEYCAIPYADKTAENGVLKKGPGMDFFKELYAQFPDIELIAEDLGTLTPEKEQLLEDANIPGMKILQFAFTGWNHDSYYLNHNHKKQCVVYTGTHDNPTTKDWFETLNDSHKDFAVTYTNSDKYNTGKFVWDFIREAYRSVADTCIIPLQDYLVKGKEARFNEPGSTGSNWKWRLSPNYLSQDLARAIYQLADTYARLPKAEENKK
ncbi:MAG: 4-alpha-glucanotransferase [Bacillota bacterium]|nr:4-alpha-glucanotransferase [Bacillota bacterium]